MERQIELKRQKIAVDKRAAEAEAAATASAKAAAVERAAFLANELKTAEFIVGKLKEQTEARKKVAAENKAAAESAASRALVVVRAGETAVEV